jgi:hypothetical protein
VTPSVFATTMALLLTTVSATARIAPKITVPGAAEEARARGWAELAHLQAVHIAIKGCSEAAIELRKPDLTPAMTLPEAREALARANFAASEVGIDHRAVWAETTAVFFEQQAKSGGQYVSPSFCSSIHRVFRSDLERLQDTLRQLGSSRDLTSR